VIEGDIYRMVLRVPEFGAIAPNEKQSNGDISIVAQVETKLGTSGDQVGTKLGPSRDQVEILRYCQVERSIVELMALLDRTNRTKFKRQVLNPLLDSGLLEMTIPDKPTSSKQKYRLTEVGASVVKT
jgi:hypothetical protein